MLSRKMPSHWRKGERVTPKEGTNKTLDMMRAQSLNFAANELIRYFNLDKITNAVTQIIFDAWRNRITVPGYLLIAKRTVFFS